MATLAVMSAVVAVVAEATSRAPGASRPALAARPVVGSGAEAPADRPPAVRRPRSRLDVRKLLRVTPIVTGGVPAHRVIALTFDDGPSPYTPQIVRELTRMHAAATFFVVGQQLEYFSAGLRDEIRHRFEVEDHTENHPWLIRLGRAAQYGQIRAVAARLERLGAPAPTLFRPPYGAYDAATVAILRQMHMLGVLWSVDPGDWRRPGTRAIVRGVLAAARPGAIVELHDGGGDRSETVAAVPAIVNGLRRRHYVLVTVSRLLRLDPPARQRRLPHLGAA